MPVPQILHFLHFQIAEELSRSTKAERNLRPLAKRTLHDEDVVKEVGQIALKVSDSEICLLVWLTETILIRLSYQAVSEPQDTSICWMFNELVLYSWLALGYNGITPGIRTFCLTHHVANLLEGKVIGQTISHYKILEKLGEGGMGVVYKAEDKKLGRNVALKFLAPELTRDAAARTRFIHEAKAAAALSHQNICTIHEIDEFEGQFFIAMECCEGETLAERIAEGPLPIDEAIDIASQIAQGLAKAHEQDIVHRDIKPANIFITQDKQVKVVDFGLAKFAGQTRLTRTGTTVGTVAYMSPEQTSGTNIDHRTDIWSFGVILYEMLSGQLPFRGEIEAALMYSVVHEDPKPLSSIRPSEKATHDCSFGHSAQSYFWLPAG